MNTNKREFFRLDISEFFHYKLIKVTDDLVEVAENEIKVKIVNISGGGCVIISESNLHLTENNFFFGHIYISYLTRSIPVLCSFIREFDQMIDGKLYHLIALKFAEIDISDQDLIIEHLNKKIIEVKK